MDADVEHTIAYYQEKRAERLRHLKELQEKMAQETDPERIAMMAEWFDRLRIEEKSLEQIVEDLRAGTYEPANEDEGFNLH